MGYRIFFSYQSDIKKKLNQDFIKGAINDAINQITEFKIEKPILEGFYGVGGNPPLAQAMLDQSKGSDIFIGDVTFTSSKIWQSQGVNTIEDEKSYLIEIDKPIDLKPAPNPNVLLETGYSWALKSHNRTILVFNKAFGSPRDLPVDMKGLRWPITYNLSEERLILTSKYNKEIAQLTEALEYAIRDAINSNIEYEIDRWRPLIINSNWKKDHKFPFQFTSNVRSKINELRMQIINSKHPVRVCGMQGCGKTRLVLEVFQKNGDLNYNQMNEQIIYHDYASALSGDISKQLSVLRDLNQFKLLVMDNCSLLEHQSLSKLFKNTKVKLITINTISNFDENDGATLLFENNITFEIFGKIITKNYPTLSIHELIIQFENNLEKFIALVEAGINESDFTKPAIDLITVLIGQDKVNVGAIKLLTAISLFEKVGISGEKKNELELVRDTFVGCSEEDIIELIELLNSKGLISKKGDYVVANSFKQELIQYWKEQPIEDVNLVVKNVSNINNLWHNFSDKFFDFLIIPGNENYIEILNSKTGALHNEEFIDSDPGGEFLELLADYYPEITMEVLISKIGRL
jgi:hypothetical protein